MLSDPQIHYLDNAATTRVDPAVTEVIHDALVELWANPAACTTRRGRAGRYRNGPRPHCQNVALPQR